MPHYSQHTLIGHVGGEPELRYTGEGVAVCTFSLAVNNAFRKDEPPVWYRVTTWRKLAETCNQYVSKGAALMVVGDWLEVSEWTDKQEKARFSLELTAQRVVFLGKQQNESRQQEPDDLPF